ncbi:type IV-A pilus assembly ATPase PilB [Methylotetracoccus oryzae]|uniref:type IV-A pilus assembly ATPase PilB n=1 Tax=Methylotetracoccus oryzae TaxID=1919059 RepID=UPI00111A460C|nr:type IV-A pilus assembly ATPase PilB [Methylotetracoccus oryzae]
MTVVTTPTPLSGLAQCLVRQGVLTDPTAQACCAEAAEQKMSLVSYLVGSKRLEGRTIAEIVSREFGLPLLDLDAFLVEMAPVKLISERLIRQHRILPLYRRGNRLFVALSDPTDFHGLDEVKFQTRLATECVVVEEEKLSRFVEAVLDAADTRIADLLDSDLDNLQISAGDEDPAGDAEPNEIDDAPIVRFVNKILVDAIKKGASDIHFEPYEKFFRIRFRHDGMLHEVASPPANLASRITARLKVMSRMDIAERRVPQDGRIKMSVSRTRAIDFRVNTCPTLFGEKVVLRILDPAQAQIGIERLGFEPAQQEAFLTAINKPYGMVLVTGPTGSGKTVTLYTALNILNRGDCNISTAEDPVEITVGGINQVNVNVKTGLTFAEALRAFLRQDPDIIMVGEVRDLETAEIAVKAAQTGHMVLSTLHTNDAPQTLNRLMQMGIPPFNIASSVLLIMAQRLARRLCDHCKKELTLPHEILIAAGFAEHELDGFPVYGPVGCDRCIKGYKGRVGLFQVMPISDEINRIILSGGDVIQIGSQAAREGVATLRQSGLRKVKSGMTSLEEIERVTRE